MLALERRNLILSQLQAEKKVVVSELSSKFGVSEETIRRDLDKLDREGFAVKSYGGAVIREEQAVDFPFQIRQKFNVLGKQAMAELVSPLIHAGEHLFLDASSTALTVSKALKEKSALTVVTNSLEILAQLSDVSDWRVICIGGEMSENYLAFLGSIAERQIRQYYVDTMIFSCKALDMELGPMESRLEFAGIKQEMAERSKRRILVADSSKFDKTSLIVGCGWDRIDMLVTDAQPPAAWKEHLAAVGVECIYPGSAA